MGSFRPTPRVTSRLGRWAGAAGHHGYGVKLRLAGMVPEDTLRSTPAAVAGTRSKELAHPARALGDSV